MDWTRRRGAGLAAASAVLLGTTPALGKLAIEAGLAPLAVVAARTAGAAALLLIVVLIFRRSFLTIYPVGMAGCFLAGGLNGLGSLLYYTGLARLDAGLAQLLFSLYPVFVAVLLFLDGQRYTLLTLARLGLSLPAVYLRTRAAGAPAGSGADRDALHPAGDDGGRCAGMADKWCGVACGGALGRGRVAAPRADGRH